jgi:hypothetical protein
MDFFSMWHQADKHIGWVAGIQEKGHGASRPRVPFRSICYRQMMNKSRHMKIWKLKNSRKKSSSITKHLGICLIFKLSVSGQSSTYRNNWKQTKQHVEHAKLILYTNIPTT